MTFDWLVAAGILVGFLLAALVARLVWMRALGGLMREIAPGLNAAFLVPLRGLVTWGLVLLGVYYAFGSIHRVAGNRALTDLIARAAGVCWVLLAIWTAMRCFNAIVAWYVRQAEIASGGQREIESQAGFLRKTVTIVVALLGLLYVLRAAGVDIQPLLASGAIGGLAVALALQDTLSNVFAGYALAIDRPVRVGDFVKLETGGEGFVEEIGWRNTRIRMWDNNVVVVPNAKLSQSIITNYYLPRQDMTIYVPCGVAYDSDLERVEHVALEVAREVQNAVVGADPEWEPAVRWKEFGDSAILFVVAIRAKDFGQHYVLQSEFIKALHARFRLEGIEIPFPIRTVVMKPTPAGSDDGRQPALSRGAAPDQQAS